MNSGDRNECDELEALRLALEADGRALADEADIPSSAIVWWRAQSQARVEAREKAEGPMTLVHGIAAACAGGLMATAAGIYVPTLRRALEWLGATIRDAAGLPIPAEPLSNPIVLALIAAMAIGALLTPIALYFTLRED